MRQRRWRARRKANGGTLPHVEVRGNINDINRYNQVDCVTHERRSVTISTIDMCGLAARLESGSVTGDELALASRLIIELVCRLPPDSTLKFI